MENSVSLPSSAIGEIARINSNVIPVFRKYGIDFYGKGKCLLSEACALAKCNETNVLADLKEALLKPIDEEQNFNAWSLDLLTERIVAKHHHYVNTNVPEIMGLFHNALASLKTPVQELTRMKDSFRQLGNDMKQHMQKEELALFPFIKKMESSSLSPETAIPSVQSLISVIEFEHDTSAIILKQIIGLRQRVAESDYINDEINLLFRKLQEFEADLIMHIHVENNVLHKKAIEMELELTTGQVN